MTLSITMEVPRRPDMKSTPNPGPRLVGGSHTTVCVGVGRGVGGKGAGDEWGWVWKEGAVLGMALEHSRGWLGRGAIAGGGLYEGWGRGQWVGDKGWATKVAGCSRCHFRYKLQLAIQAATFHGRPLVVHNTNGWCCVNQPGLLGPGVVLLLLALALLVTGAVSFPAACAAAAAGPAGMSVQPLTPPWLQVSCTRGEEGAVGALLRRAPHLMLLMTTLLNPMLALFTSSTEGCV
jgi:hypothetical protein